MVISISVHLDATAVGSGFVFIFGVGAPEIVVLTDFNLLVFGLEGNHAMALVAHVGLDGLCVVLHGVAVKALEVLGDFSVEIVDEAIEIHQIFLLGDEHAVVYAHVVHVGVNIG